MADKQLTSSMPYFRWGYRCFEAHGVVRVRLEPRLQM